MSNLLKWTGILLSIAGAGITIATDQINERKMTETIREEVRKECAEHFNNEDDEEEV